MKRTILAFGLVFVSACYAFAQDSLFDSPIFYDAGIQPASIFASDLNGDGAIDLAVANWMNNGTVSILMNNGDGTFGSPVAYPAGFLPVSVVCADFDGDTYDDLAVSNNAGIAILMNNGDGTFQDTVRYFVNSPSSCVYASDFDGDGDIDLAVGLNSINIIAILTNDGNGTFERTANYSTDYAPPVSLVAVDLDGDSDKDLAVATESWMAILLSNGDGTFQPDTNYICPIPVSVAAADFDRDGNQDLAVASYYGSVYVHWNNGDGTFDDPDCFDIYNTITSVFAPLLDEDDDYDLVTTNLGAGNISFLRNNNDRTFQFHVDYQVSGSPSSAFAADLDGDGDNDLAVANYYHIAILLNRTIQSEIDNQPELLPQEIKLSQNYPNPFNAQTIIDYYLPAPTMVSINIFDLTGKMIATLVEGAQPAGNNQAIWNAGNQASGIYFCRIKAVNKVITIKMELIK